MQLLFARLDDRECTLPGASKSVAEYAWG